MMQLKAIFSDLLRHYEFELAQPPASYHNDHSKMVVQLQQPCRARYRRRAAASEARRTNLATNGTASASGAFRIRVDSDLCQGHGVCVSEAPGVFVVERAENKVVVLQATPDETLRERVELAVEHCPTRALSIEPVD